MRNIALFLPGVSGSAECVDDDEGEDELHAELPSGPARPAAPVRVRHHPEVGFLNILCLFHTTFQPNDGIT